MKKINIVNIVNIIIDVVILIFYAYFAISGLYLFFSQNIAEENKIYTSAIVTEFDSGINEDGEKEYIIFISYSADNIEYTDKLTASYPGYQVGDEIKIYYDKNNPKKYMNVASESNLILTLVPGILFSFAFVVKLIKVLRKFLKSKNEYQNIMTSGIYVSATYVETKEIGTTASGTPLCYVVCEWVDPATNQKHLFKSESIMFNPHNYIIKNNITTFYVMLNPKNFNEYKVDISTIQNIY